MPLRLDIKRKLLARSDRVKSVDLHPTEPWLLVGLYNGNVHIWNFETSQLLKTFEIGDLPVRTAKFVARKSWVVVGSDDMLIRVFNYNTLEKVHQFEAHSDYIRSMVVHNSQPFVLSSSDDMMIKLWDFEAKWSMKQTFEGHTHYVMQIAINPKDNNTFATASLDKTVKVWQFGSHAANFTLEGHEKGVNCVDYYHGGDKPYLISGADDHVVKIWDYQNKTCVQTLTGHSQNVSAVAFHPELPLIITGAEDSTVRLWHSNTYRLESTLNYGLERVWCVMAQKGTNTIALGYDEGSVIVKLGRDEPAASMDASGKIVWAKHSEIQLANLKSVDAETLENAQDGERLSLSVKDMGSSEVFPHSITHSPNGRFVTACGDGEYIVYTGLSLRNKDFGSALEFVWAPDSNYFAIRESATNIKIKKNFKDFKQIRSETVLDGLNAGPLLAARSTNNVCFFDWETSNLIRRIELANPKHVAWNDAGNLVALCAEDSFYILKYNADAFNEATATEITEDGVEAAFDVVGEHSDAVKTGFWVGDCFVYTTVLNRLNYYVGGEIVTIAHVDRPIFLLGYMAKESRIYAIDKDLNVISYKLLLSVLEYQTAVMRRDFESADKVLGSVPKEQRTRVAHFLEKQGFKRQALAVSQDPDHKFDLAISLGDLKVAFELAKQSDSEEKWKQLANVATAKSEIRLAGECHRRARDLGALLLLATASGSADLLSQLTEDAAAANLHNVNFMGKLLLGDVNGCLEILISSDRLPEAAFFARTHCPSQVPRVVALWKDKAAKVSGNTSRKIGDSLADPSKYENLFPGYGNSLRAEAYLGEIAHLAVPASVRPPPASERDVIDEVKQAVESGALTFNENGEAILHGVQHSPKKQQNEIVLDDEPVVERVAVAPVAAAPSHRQPTPPPPREPTPEPEPEEENDEPVEEPGRYVEPDLVAERPKPDVVPVDEAPDLVHHEPRSQPDDAVDSEEGRWSDDDFGDPSANDINLDDLNLDDED